MEQPVSPGRRRPAGRLPAVGPLGERVAASAPSSSESAMVITAMGLDGVRAPLALPGSVNAEAFESYVEQVLVPASRPGDVAVFEAIERAGASVLPRYSPDFPPIEEVPSKFKEFPRRIGARAKRRLNDSIGEGL